MVDLEKLIKTINEKNNKDFDIKINVQKQKYLCVEGKIKLEYR